MHSNAAWTWFSQRKDDRFFFCRLTQFGLLRLLATFAVMGKDVRTIGEAWKVYDRWEYNYESVRAGGDSAGRLKVLGLKEGRWALVRI
jgi:hypothetical protein